MPEIRKPRLCVVRYLFLHRPCALAVACKVDGRDFYWLPFDGTRNFTNYDCTELTPAEIAATGDAELMAWVEEDTCIALRAHIEQQDGVIYTLSQEAEENEQTIAAQADRIDSLESVLRSLASYVAAGGYNADEVDPKVFEGKIRWGIDQGIERERKLIAEIETLKVRLLSAAAVKIPTKEEFLSSCERFHSQIDCLTLAQLIAENQKQAAEIERLRADWLTAKREVEHSPYRDAFDALEARAWEVNPGQWGATAWEAINDLPDAFARVKAERDTAIELLREIRNSEDLRRPAGANIDKFLEGITLDAGEREIS